MFRVGSMAHMPRFDYDVVIIGSGFGGSVAALRAAEKGYRVAVMEAGRRWKDEDLPRNNWDLKDYVWFPAAGMYGIQRLEERQDGRASPTGPTSSRPVTTRRGGC